MAGIEIPRRLPAGGNRRRGETAPTVEDVGQVRIARDPGLNAPAGAFGAQTGEALVQAGQSLSGVGKSLADASETIRRAERRSAVASAVVDATTDLKQWTFDRDKDPDYQSFGERFEAYKDQIRDKYSEGLDEKGKQEFDLQFKLFSTEEAFKVRKKADKKAVDQALANMNSSLDGIVNMAANAETPEEYDMFLAMGLEVIGRGVDDGIISAIDGEKVQSEFLSTTDEVQAMQAVVENPTAALELLNDSEIFPNLDEKRRIQLIKEATVQVRLEEARAERERARREVAVGRDVADAVYVLSRGRVPDNLAGVRAAAQGTRYEADLNAAINNRAAVEEFMRLPFAEQGRQLRGMASAGGGTTRTRVELEESLVRAYTNLSTMISQGNGLAAASMAGAIDEPAPLDFSDPTTLAERGEQAQLASRWAGLSISPLMDSEADALSASIDGASPGEVTGLLQSLHKGLGEEQAGVLASQIAPKRPELAAALSLVPYQPGTSREIVVGGRALRENPDLKPGKADRLPAVESVYGNLFTPEGASALAAYQEAATALYAARRIASGETSFDGDTYEQALRDVAGGPVVWNGRTILPPVPGMDEGAVEDMLDGLTNEDMVFYGNGAPVYADGSAFTVEDFSRGLFQTDAQLVSSGPGRYLVFMPGLGYVQSDAGGAFELNLGAKLR